jgi:DNA modification methylase
VILHGDCRQQLATLEDCSVDSIVTDPPYELGFMGKKWDASGIAYDPTVWTECLRVLKPGGHLLAFGGTRTYHRMTVAIEDAGFEIRDSLHWLYGSGFPKSLDVSKAIDKQRDAELDAAAAVAKWLCDRMAERNITRRDVSEHFNAANIAQQWTTHWTDGAVKPRVPTWEQWQELCLWLDLPDDMSSEVWRLNGRKGQPGENWAKREIIGERDVPVGHSFAGPVYGGDSSSVTVHVTVPATDAARTWDGWGTALKPAHEPIVLARKPLVGTVAANVMAYGTGALNIDATRIGYVSQHDQTCAFPGGATTSHAAGSLAGPGDAQDAKRTLFTAERPAGRWPANLVLTHSPDCQQTGTGTSRIVDKERGRRPGSANLGNIGGTKGDPMPNGPTYDDTPERWECAPGCPVAALNTQSGTTRDGVAVQRNGGNAATVGYEGGWRKEPRSDQTYGGSGGASRFFTTTEWDPEYDAPFLYVAKPSRKERNAGCDGLPEGTNIYGMRPAIPEEGDKPGSVNDKFQTRPSANFHPTVKPVALMRHLIRLVTPPDGTVLDPFLGSGTTAVAATLEGFDWIGCELNDDYLPIIKARVAWAEQHQPEPDLTLFNDAQ